MPKTTVKGYCYVCQVNGKLTRTKLTCVDCRMPICESHSDISAEIGMWGMGCDVVRCKGCRAKKKQKEVGYGGQCKQAKSLHDRQD